MILTKKNTESSNIRTINEERFLPRNAQFVEALILFKRVLSLLLIINLQIECLKPVRTCNKEVCIYNFTVSH